MMRFLEKFAGTWLVGLGLLAAMPAQAESRLLCVYDPAGKSGHFYATMEAFATDASAYGPDIELKAYTDEETAAKDYEAKDITVEGCTFVGSEAPIAFVGVDGATVRFNTIYRSHILLILLPEETAIPTSNGQIDFR